MGNGAGTLGKEGKRGRRADPRVKRGMEMDAGDGEWARGMGKWASGMRHDVPRVGQAGAGEPSGSPIKSGTGEGKGQGLAISWGLGTLCRQNPQSTQEAHVALA